MAEKYHLGRLSLAPSLTTLPPYEEQNPLDSHQSVRYEGEYNRMGGEDGGEGEDGNEVVVPVVL